MLQSPGCKLDTCVVVSRSVRPHSVDRKLQTDHYRTRNRRKLAEDLLCIHFVITVLRMCILHVEHFRSACSIWLSIMNSRMRDFIRTISLSISACKPASFCELVPVLSNLNSEACLSAVVRRRKSSSAALRSSVDFASNETF